MAARTPFRCCSESESALSPKLCAFPGWPQTMTYSRAGPWSKRAQSGCVVQARNWPESWAVLNFFLCLCFMNKHVCACFLWVVCRFLTAFLLFSLVFKPAKGTCLPSVRSLGRDAQHEAGTTTPSQGSPDHCFTLPVWVCLDLTALVVQESFCQSSFCFQWEFLHMWMYFLGLHETK